MSEKDPYREGFRARGAELPITSNPYQTLTDAWTLWVEGFMERDEHETGKVAALDSIGWFG
jgi:hypothetical protein